MGRKRRQPSRPKRRRPSSRQSTSAKGFQHASGVSASPWDEGGFVDDGFFMAPPVWVDHHGPHDCTYHLPKGVSIQFSGKDTQVHAPPELIDDFTFQSMVCEMMLEHHGMLDEFCELRDTQGVDAAMRLVGAIGNITFTTLEAD